MRTYISPIGYNPTSVTRVLLSRGLETDDTALLLRPAKETDDTRAQETIADVKRMLQEIKPAVSLTVERIPHDDFPLAVRQCSEFIHAAEGTVIANLSGGARDIYLPFTVAVLAQAPLIDTALAFSDIDGRVREWELPVLTADIPNSTRETLRLIAAADEEITIPELTDHTDQAKSTVTRHVNQLAAAGVVTTWQEGKTKHVRPTLTGQLLLPTDHHDHADQ
jgi:CRISPR-associated protein Csa3